MPPPVILDPATLDLAHVVADRDAIAQLNPHRYEFQLLDAVVLCDLERLLFAGYYDIKPDAWWRAGTYPAAPYSPVC